METNELDIADITEMLPIIHIISEYDPAWSRKHERHIVGLLNNSSGNSKIWLSRDAMFKSLANYITGERRLVGFILAYDIPMPADERQLIALKTMITLGRTKKVINAEKRNADRYNLEDRYVLAKEKLEIIEKVIYDCDTAYARWYDSLTTTARIMKPWTWAREQRNDANKKQSNRILL